MQLHLYKKQKITNITDVILSNAAEWRQEKYQLPREVDSFSFLFLNLNNGFHCPHNYGGRLRSLWSIIQSVSSLNWRFNNISILSLVEREGGNETKWSREHFNKTSAREKKQNFWLKPSGNTRYKVVAMFPLQSVFCIQFGWSTPA